jgi:15-cis-phytoene synthase
MTPADTCAALVRERDLDRYLATLYAPGLSRPGLFALHALDLELAEIVRTTSEPMLGQIRLAWWREQLQTLDATVRPAQPVLAALAEHVLPIGVTGASLEALEDANLALLDDDLGAAVTARATLFEVAVRLLIASPDPDSIERARQLGTGWATIDAGRQGRALTPTDFERADHAVRRAPSPRAARPLFALAALARIDLAALRDGRPPAPRGTPGRQARLLWSIVTGR